MLASPTGIYIIYIYMTVYSGVVLAIAITTGRSYCGEGEVGRTPVTGDCLLVTGTIMSYLSFPP